MTVTVSTLQALMRDLASTRTSTTSADARRSRAQRRGRGVYFTPMPLVRFTVTEAIQARMQTTTVHWRDDGSPTLRILDPCTGDGRFLTAASDVLADLAARRGYERTSARAAIVQQCLFGIERDAEFAAIAEREVGATIFCGDALLAPPSDMSAVDIVIGNPPYVRSIHMQTRERKSLQGRYASTSHGEWDLYAAFIEQSLRWLSPGGEVALVVPSRWFTAAFAKRLRQLLAKRGAVRAIVDFGAAQIFPDATTYTSVSFLSRVRQQHVTVARHLDDDTWTSGQLQADELTGAPWNLAVGVHRALLEQLSAHSVTLGEIAHIAKGVGTNADRVYVLERATTGANGVRGFSRAIDEFVEVEAAACRPCVRGRDIAAYGSIGETVQCIAPYERDGSLWTPDKLAALPGVAAYLEQCRDVLQARESGKYRDARFYRFGRPQNLAFLGDPAPKLVFPDVARHGRALLDHSGGLVLDSAYALRLRPSSNEYSLPLILALLHAPVLGFWLRQTGIPLRGGYVRMKTAYLSTLPVPRPSEHTAQIDRLVRATLRGDRSRADVVNDAMRRAYGLSIEMWSHFRHSTQIAFKTTRQTPDEPVRPQ